MKFCATATPMAAARPFELPAPMPIAAVATVASMSESLSAMSVTAPPACTVLSAMTALAVLRMLLTEAAPPPAMANALPLADPAIATLAATVIEWISASSDAVNATAPMLAVTIDRSISASTSLSTSFSATEMPTAMAPALPPVEPLKAIAPAIASERILALSAAVNATPAAPVAVTVLLPMPAWMSLSMLFTAATPAPARAPAVLELDAAPAAEIVSASASIWSPDVAPEPGLLSARKSTPEAVNVELFSVAKTSSSMVFSATATPTDPDSAVPLADRAKATATAPASAVMCALSVACNRAVPCVAWTVLFAIVAAMVCLMVLDVPTPAPANAPVTPVLPLLPAAAPEPPAARA